MNYTIEKAGRLDGIQYYNLMHNGDIIATNTKSFFIGCKAQGFIYDLIETFYQNNPHLA